MVTIIPYGYRSVLHIKLQKCLLQISEIRFCCGDIDDQNKISPIFDPKLNYLHNKTGITETLKGTFRDFGVVYNHIHMGS